jgi:hypothetical protein
MGIRGKNPSSLKHTVSVPVREIETWLQEVSISGSNLSTASVPVREVETWLQEASIGGSNLSTASVSFREIETWLQEVSIGVSNLKIASVPVSVVLRESHEASIICKSQSSISIAANINWTRSFTKRNPPVGLTSGLGMGPFTFSIPKRLGKRRRGNSQRSPAVEILH